MFYKALDDTRCRKIWTAVAFRIKLDAVNNYFPK
jgi:hypothetical protein